MTKREKRLDLSQGIKRLSITTKREKKGGGEAAGSGPVPRHLITDIQEGKGREQP